MTAHAVKCWPEFFQAILDGRKTFEARYNDRDYQEGDELTVQEYDPAAGGFTGRALNRTIGYVLPVEMNTPPIVGLYAVLSLLPAATEGEA